MHLSVGLAGSRQSGGDGDELIRNADVAMYQAKSKGKARFELFEPQMAAAILRRHDFKEELAKAIEREQMIVQYQPIVDAATAAGSSPPRRSCAGSIPRAAWSRPPSSSRWPRRPG